MKIKDIVDTLQCNVIFGDDLLNREVEFAFASDLMSDVLTTDVTNLLLITGLANLQTIRTAEMADIFCILFVRNKHITKPMLELAKKNDIVLLQHSCSLFKTCGELYKAGVSPIF